RESMFDHDRAGLIAQKQVVELDRQIIHGTGPADTLGQMAGATKILHRRHGTALDDLDHKRRPTGLKVSLSPGDKSVGGDLPISKKLSSVWAIMFQPEGDVIVATAVIVPPIITEPALTSSAGVVFRGTIN